MISHRPAQPPSLPLATQLAIVTLVAVMVLLAGLWVADSRTAWSAPALWWFLQGAFSLLALGLIVLPAGRTFLAKGQPNVLMLGWSMLVALLGAAAGTWAYRRDLDTGLAIHNTVMLVSALGHGSGVAFTALRKVRLRRTGAWLAATYAGGMAVVAAVVWAAHAGWRPAFSIEGQGPTLVRTGVVLAAVTLLTLAAGMLWRNHRRAPSASLPWYALGLVLMAAGLGSSLAISAQDTPLHWAVRGAQLLATLYLCVAALSPEGAAWPGTPLAGVDVVWRDDVLPAHFRRPTPLGQGLRYGLAAAAVAASWILRLVLTHAFGGTLPPYITFYPAVMLTALLGGLGPGVLATALAAFSVSFWLLDPAHQLAVAAPVDRLSLMLFTGMNLFCCLVAERHRQDRDKAAAYDRMAATREREEEVRELSQRLSYHVDNSPLAVIEWGPDMRLARWSGEAERMFGWRAEEVLGKRIEDFRWVYSEDEGQVDEVRTELTTGANPRRFSANRNYRKDGSVVHCEWYNSSLMDETGRVRSILSLVLDVTDRTRLEARLKEEVRRKDDFLALLGHELRNPLGPIGMAMTLIHGGEPDTVARACDIVGRQVRHMGRLVDDLLDISRINRGRIHLQRESLDLVAAVRTVIADYRPIIDEQGQTLDAELPPGPLCIDADPARVVQMVSNLLQNAVKFTGRDGRIELSVRRAGPRVQVRVRDTGAGISAGHLTTIFEPFVQSHTTVGRSPGGLGLGLALVKELAGLHGGTVAAHSDGPGLGAEFILELPALETPAPPGPAPSPRAQAGSRRILVIEDLPDAAQALLLLLQAQGHAAQAAPDGETGLDLAIRIRPELILCDLGLPGAMDGFHVARRIRNTPGLEGVRLIAMTGFGSQEDKARALEAGFDLHLTKPVDPELLVRVVSTRP